MDIEELSKTQLLLLTILVSFVTSIATGVLTVSLLDQAPTTVTQTVNRIVDHTIETVTTQVPVIGGVEPAPPSTEDLLVGAVAVSSARTVTLYRDDAKRVPVGVGLYLPVERIVVVVSSEAPSKAYVGFADGSLVATFRTKEDGNVKAYGFATDAVLPQAPAARLVPTTEIKQGQTVIAISSEGNATTGIVSRIEGTSITTNLPLVPAGAGAVNLAGDVVGISGGGGLILSADRIASLIAPDAP